MRRWIYLLAAAALAQTGSKPSDVLLAGHNPADFPALYREAMDAFFFAEEAYRQGDYARTSSILNAFWATNPAGAREWGREYRLDFPLGQTKGVNFGAPVCYNALRMLTEAAAWREKSGGKAEGKSADIQWTVLLADHSAGVMPATPQELRDRKGAMVRHDLDPKMLADANAIVEQSTWLFREFVHAMTGGRLTVHTSIVPLPDLEVPVEITAGPLNFATLTAGAERRIWGAVPESVRAATDWWWVIYPSHFPEQSKELAELEYITGGMSVGPDRQSPSFLIDDLWLLRKPSPYAGRTPYTEAERRAYLPQWFQHEFFHHLFREYPQFQLEAKSHQWFDRKTWPADFEGLMETDYYIEALHKRLQAATPPLWVKLRYAAPPREVWDRITTAKLVGRYRRTPVENPWHEGDIEQQPSGLAWRNAANRQWGLKPNLKEGMLDTDPTDNPYFLSNPSTGQVFLLVLRRDADGEYLPEVAGFRFNGEFYAKQ